MPKLQVTMRKSLIGEKPTTRNNMAALGLRRIGDVVVHEDRPEIKGMIRKVQHLVTVEEVK